MPRAIWTSNGCTRVECMLAVALNRRVPPRPTRPVRQPRWPSSKSSSTCAAHAIKGALTDFRVEETECLVSFKGPGYAADAFIDRESGHYRISETYHGLVAVINDLHKGRDTGPVWSVVIDVSAILMTVVSLTGLVLLFYLKLKRVTGVIVALAGTVIVILLLRYGVP